jgi:hypothetical protein
MIPPWLTLVWKHRYDRLDMSNVYGHNVIIPSSLTQAKCFQGLFPERSIPATEQFENCNWNPVSLLGVEYAIEYCFTKACLELVGVWLEISQL